MNEREFCSSEPARESISDDKNPQELQLPNSQIPAIDGKSPNKLDINSREEDDQEKSNIFTEKFSIEDEKVLKPIGKFPMGSNFSNSFLLYKYQINKELFSLSKTTQNLGNLKKIIKILYFLKKNR